MVQISRANFLDSYRDSLDSVTFYIFDSLEFEYGNGKIHGFLSSFLFILFDTSILIHQFLLFDTWKGFLIE